MQMNYLFIKMTSESQKMRWCYDKLIKKSLSTYPKDNFPSFSVDGYPNAKHEKIELAQTTPLRCFK